MLHLVGSQSFAGAVSHLCDQIQAAACIDETSAGVVDPIRLALQC